MTSVPSRTRSVTPARKASVVQLSSMSCQAPPNIGIWRKWSITQMLSKPASSAAAAIGGEPGPQLGRAARPRPHRDLQPEARARPAPRPAARPAARRGPRPAARCAPRPGRARCRSPRRRGPAAARPPAAPAGESTASGTGLPRARLRARHSPTGVANTTAAVARPCRRASASHAARRAGLEAERVDDGGQPPPQPVLDDLVEQRERVLARRRDPPRPHRPPPAAGRSTRSGPGRSARPPTTTCPAPTRPPAPPGTGKAAGWSSPRTMANGNGGAHVADDCTWRTPPRCSAPSCAGRRCAAPRSRSRWPSRARPRSRSTLGVVSFRSGGAAGVGLVALAADAARPRSGPPLITPYADRTNRVRVLVVVVVVPPRPSGPRRCCSRPTRRSPPSTGWRSWRRSRWPAFRPVHSALLPALCTDTDELTSANVVRGVVEAAGHAGRTGPGRACC